MTMTTKTYTVREVFETDVPRARNNNERGQLYRELRLRLEKTHRPQALAVQLDGNAKHVLNVSAYLRRAFERDLPGQVLIVARSAERTVYLRWK